MKKAYVFLLAILMGIFIFPTVSMAQTFNLPSPVRVSGDASGNLNFQSDNPAALDKIDGVVQFHNDIMKSRGWGMTNNAFREGTRVNPNLLTVSLYDGTLRTQFSFNIKSGALWGLIPSCMLIPDNRTVIVEYSGPSQDSENGQGGHHFSLIAGITDPSYYKRVADIQPCPDGIAAAGGGQIVEQTIPISPEPRQYTPTKIIPVYVAKKSVPIQKALKKAECDPCIEIKKVQDAVGEATEQEKANELGDLHKKATKQIKVAEENRKAIGAGKPNKDGKVLTVHEKIDELTKKGVGLLEKIDKQTSHPEESKLISPEENPQGEQKTTLIKVKEWLLEKVWWIVGIIVIFLIVWYFRPSRGPLTP